MDVMYRGRSANGAPTPGAATPNPDTPASDGKKKRKKKNKKNKHATETPEGKTNGEGAKTTESPAATKTAASPAATKTAASPAAVKEVALKKEINKKYPNGLEVQTLAIGKPDAKQAAAGKKVGKK